MAKSSRYVQESPVDQGPYDQIFYIFSFDELGGSPTSPVVELFDMEDLSDQASKLVGSASVDGDDVLTPIVQDLVRDHTYSLRVSAVVNGSKLSNVLTILVDSL